MRPLRLLPLAAALAALAASACSILSEPADPPLSGEWRALCGVDVACALKLELHGTSISGRYGGASVFGTNYYADVSGTYAAPQVHLEWTIGQQHEQFDGVVRGDTALIGVRDGSPGDSIRYFRQH